MTTKALDRIVELWPLLPEEVQADLVTRVEAVAANVEPVEFTPEELAGIERGREDFKHGRTLSLPEYRTDMDAFFDRLKAKAQSAS